MRADMKKVLTERPRTGGYYKYKNFRPRKSQGEYDIDLPCCEGMRRPYGYEQKTFSDLLGPLQKFLRGCVGRRWDDVWSEICSVVNGGSTVDQHLRGHVDSEIELHVQLKDGHLVDAIGRSRYRLEPTNDLPYGLYVDPRDGIVYYNERPIKKKKEYVTVDDIRYYRGDDGLLYPVDWYNTRKPCARYLLKIIGSQKAMHIKGIWYWITVENVPPPAKIPYILNGKPAIRVVYYPRYDFVTGNYVKEGVYHADRHQMSSRDLRRHGLLNTRSE